MERNPGLDFSYKLIQVHLNEPATNTWATEISAIAKKIEGPNKIAWLIKAITCIDLTTLGGDDTSANVRTLCEKAVEPIKLNFEWKLPLHTAAVCVYPARVKDAFNVLCKLDTSKKVAIASAAGFPTGQYPLSTRLDEIRYAIAEGATEIDVVINRTLALEHKWHELYLELKDMREACGEVHMKTILAVGELYDLRDVYVASMVAMMAGSDFIKTSTGKETINATLPAGIVMCRAIRDYRRVTGYKVGFKPAGGIKNSTNALEWLTLVKEELGEEWMTKDLFRIGASSLLDDIVNTIQRLST
ncbi:deoxyribose-phosphate aldolase isoform X2 [Cephus cinctus]|uniref:deoxyribose-phosphate aldolase n=1 Tax=Cephus cinctus TaxID=211228 RepID=A0AAJ7BQZ8_CEPCN|nr:deoxyribose-phosphate aldolase isoform X2 [Cephus cinctus]